MGFGIGMCCCPPAGCSSSTGCMGGDPDAFVLTWTNTLITWIFTNCASCDYGPVLPTVGDKLYLQRVGILFPCASGVTAPPGSGYIGVLANPNLALNCLLNVQLCFVGDTAYLLIWMGGNGFVTSTSHLFMFSSPWNHVCSPPVFNWTKISCCEKVSVDLLANCCGVDTGTLGDPCCGYLAANLATVVLDLNNNFTTTAVTWCGSCCAAKKLNCEWDWTVTGLACDGTDITNCCNHHKCPPPSGAFFLTPTNTNDLNNTCNYQYWSGDGLLQFNVTVTSPGGGPCRYDATAFGYLDDGATLCWSVGYTGCSGNCGVPVVCSPTSAFWRCCGGGPPCTGMPNVTLTLSP